MSNKQTRLDITVLAFTLALFLVPPVLAKTPLVGTMDLSWNPAWYPGAKARARISYGAMCETFSFLERARSIECAERVR
jgi:hypothetical protein